MRPTAFVVFAALLPGCGKGSGPPEPEPPQPVPATAADYAAVQGKWSIIRVEQDSGAATLGPATFQNFEVTIEGQTVEIAMKGLGSCHAVFALDAEKAPRHLDFAETDADGN